MTNIVARLFKAIGTLDETRRERDERGATMVEYAILVATISIAAIAVILLIGPLLVDVFQAVVNALTPIAPA
jgi:pilus assembly protein Flp/PilA